MALILKRCLDVVGSLLALAVLGLPMLLIALGIRLDSPGPALYVSERSGKKGRRFHFYKFRTMVRNAEQRRQELECRNERCGPFFKMHDDPRLTRLGRWLRKYSLDELPQLWNVLHGDMSLVGPRPHPVADVSLYRPEHFRRLDATPGITGLWQVEARCDPSFERNVALDLQYIRNWSLWLDFKILARTIPAVLSGGGE
jgi:lipopolysaccharide/colanic/teichoic acid biosynthesis glycosyltransferase